MKETNDFLMPEYYTEFECKKGDCRSACCVGWPITVSQENYFRLLGMDCPPDLRSKLDVGLRMADRPTPEHYACFNPRYDGDCPMRMDDGRCSIHAEIGEDELPDICRLYPRGIRVDGVRECSCSNSCEAVSELFLRMDEPMKFVSRTITVKVPDNAYAPGHDHTEEEREERMKMIGIMQTRSMTVAERLASLGGMLGCGGIEPGDGAEGAEMLSPMIEVLASHHDSIRECAGEAVLCFRNAQGGFDSAKYLSAKENFAARYPAWENYFEHLIVNHIFFSRFPVTERKMERGDVWKALVFVYALLRFTAVGYTAAHTEVSDLVDAVSACFRMIDHTEFEPYAAALMKKYSAFGDCVIARLLGV